MQPPLTPIATSLDDVGGLGLSLDKAGLEDDNDDTGAGRREGKEQESIEDIVKAAFVTGYQSAVSYSADVEFGELHKGTLGPEQIVGLIAEGYAPEEIGYQIAKRDSLVEQFRQLVLTSIRDMALGYTVCQLADQLLNVAPLSSDAKKARLTAVRNRMAEMDRGPLTTTTQLPKYNYEAVYEYVEAELHNGELVGDPAWINDQKRRKKKGVSWRDRLVKSIAMLDQAFDEAVKQLDWTALMGADVDLLRDARPEEFSDAAVHIFQQIPAQVAQGPARPDGTTTTSVSASSSSTPGLSAQTIRTVGRAFRTVLLDGCKARGNEHFAAGEYVLAEDAYQKAILGGTNDPAAAVNLAQVLLKLGKFRYAENAATIGLYQIEAASGGLQHGASASSSYFGTSETRQPRQHEASRAYRGTDVELLALKYKALIRRGRARRAMLEQLGGLKRAEETEERAVEVGLDQEEEKDEKEQAEERGKMLLGARSDFTKAMHLDANDEVARAELATLAIDPRQRRPSEHGAHGLALASHTDATGESSSSPPSFSSLLQRGGSEPAIPSSSLL